MQLTTAPLFEHTKSRNVQALNNLLMQIVGLENQATEKSFGGVVRLVSSSRSATRPSFGDQLIRCVYARRWTPMCMHGAIVQSRSGTGFHTTVQDGLGMYSQQTLPYTVAHSVQSDFVRLYSGQDFYSSIGCSTKACNRFEIWEDGLFISGNLGRTEE